MAESVDPGLLRDLQEAKAALTRHGIVIIRAIETELEPALISGAKTSLASAPGRLGKLDEDHLDRLVEKLRKISMKSVEELRDLYVHLLARLGETEKGDAAIDLEGIGQLFSWERIAQAADPVNRRLEADGFPPIQIEGPEALSEGFALELTERWPPAFERFRKLSEEASREMELRRSEASKPVQRKSRKTQGKR